MEHTRSTWEDSYAEFCLNNGMPLRGYNQLVRELNRAYSNATTALMYSASASDSGLKTWREIAKARDHVQAVNIIVAAR